MKTLADLQEEVLEWAGGLSPHRKPQNTVVKMVSETSELLDAVLNERDVEGELADCMILLLDLADMYDVDLIQAGFAKMQINREREWAVKNGVIRRKEK